MNAPLPLPRENWHSRWLVFPTWGRLHRVSSIEWDRAEDMISGEGTTVCGRGGRLMMPGFPSRLGLPRCRLCCKGAGVPDGDGAPYNHGMRDA